MFLKGNSPTLTGDPFYNAHPDLTIYFLKGTSGWEDVFAGRPTAIWHLSDHAIHMEFLTINSWGISFAIVGSPGQAVAVQACQNLAASNWQDLEVVTLDGNGMGGFTDLDWTNFASRFYRAVSN
jgi:hypothetical protein